MHAIHLNIEYIRFESSSQFDMGSVTFHISISEGKSMWLMNERKLFPALTHNFRDIVWRNHTYTQLI